jgi:PAP2 superfamily
VRLPERPRHAPGALPGDAPPFRVSGISPPQLLPVDRLFVAVNLVFAIVFSTFVPVAPRAIWLVVAHLLALALPSALARGGPRLVPLRELYPLVGLCLFWAELGIRYPWVNTGPNDRLLTGVELALFGYQPSLAWMQLLPIAGPLMHGWYATYYLVLAGIPLLVLASRRREAIRSLVLRMSLTYFGCFLIYAVFPALGPDELFGDAAAAVGGAFYQLHAGIQAAGNSLGTAFPSSHVAGSVTLAWIAAKWCPRPVAWCSGLLAAGMLPAVIFTGQHFVLDAAAGVCLAVTLQAVVAPALEAAAVRDRDVEGASVSDTGAVGDAEFAT